MHSLGRGLQSGGLRSRATRFGIVGAFIGFETAPSAAAEVREEATHPNMSNRAKATAKHLPRFTEILIKASAEAAAASVAIARGASSVEDPFGTQP